MFITGKKDTHQFLWKKTLSLINILNLTDSGNQKYYPNGL